MINNPFTLAFGQEPQLSIKRTNEFFEIVSNFENDISSTCTYLVCGVRGSGKTVLMTNVCSYFKEKEDWIVIELNPQRDMLESMAAKLYDKVVSKFKFMTKSFSFSFHGLTFTLSGERPITDVENLIDTMLEELDKHGKRVLVAVDEASNEKSMKAFTLSFQIMRRQKRPVYLLMTGLYRNLHNLEDEKTMTFLYRAPKIAMLPLSLSDISDSYQKYIGCSEKESIQLAKLTKGYAFAYQVLGYLLFQQKKKELDEEVLRNFDSYMARSSYDKIYSDLSVKARAFLKAMATVEQKTAESIAKALHMKKGTYCSYRDDLLREGVIDAPAWGVVEFALPRFQEFVLEKAKYED